MYVYIETECALDLELTSSRVESIQFNSPKDYLEVGRSRRMVVCLRIFYEPGRKGIGEQGLGRPGNSWLTIHPKVSRSGSQRKLELELGGGDCGWRDLCGRLGVFDEGGWLDGSVGSSDALGEGSEPTGGSSLSPELVLVASRHQPPGSNIPPPPARPASLSPVRVCRPAMQINCKSCRQLILFASESQALSCGLALDGAAGQGSGVMRSSSFACTHMYMQCVG